MTVRSALGVPIVVLAEAVLLAEFGSVMVEVTVPVSVTEAPAARPAPVSAVMCTVAVAAAARLNEQVTVCPVAPQPRSLDW